MRKIAAALLFGAMAFSISLHAQTAGPDLLSDSKPRGTKGSYMNDRYPCGAYASCNLLPLVSGQPGYIDHLWTCGDAQSTIQVYVDGEATPDINVALPYLTGGFYSNNGQGPVTGRWITANGQQGAFNGILCGSMNLPIPFSHSIRVTQKNGDHGTFWIASMVSYQVGVSNNFVKTHRLHIAAGNANVAPYATQSFLSYSGSGGRLAGFSWLYDAFPNGTTPATGPLEGNFDITADGNTFSSSGAEDIFEMSFYFAQFAPPSVTQPIANGNPNIGLVWHNNYTFSAWRFFIDDPIEFNNSLSMDWHCGQSDEATVTNSCYVAWAVYYYTSI